MTASPAHPMSAFPKARSPELLFDEQGSDPTTPATDFWRLYAKAGGIYARNDAGTVVGPFASAGSVAITTEDAQQGANIAFSSGTYTDIVSVSLTAGTWDIWGWVTYGKVPGVSDWCAQIWDGSAQQAQNVVKNSNAGAVDYVTLPVFTGALVLGSTTTIYLRGYSDLASTAHGSTALGAGGGSKIHAMKIA